MGAERRAHNPPHKPGRLGRQLLRPAAEAALALAYLPNQLLDANPDPRAIALTAATLAASEQIVRSGFTPSR